MNRISRRKFIRKSALVSASGLYLTIPGKHSLAIDAPLQPGMATVISTWDFGLQANERAWEVIDGGGASLDAMEQGIRLIEADPSNHSVGYGGYPDRDGHVTLDACVMNSEGRAGAVCFLEDMMHPISVARMVMEKTPHVMLSGAGALQFALENGFEKTDLLTEESIADWKEWQKSSLYKPAVNWENHDTIGLICLDRNGRLSGGCSTSGLAYKMHGRVGDSPIIGAALFVDQEVGAAVTTGLGELVMRSLSSFLVVELMRDGLSAQSACEEAISRIVRKNPEFKDNQVGIIALGLNGETGAMAIHPGFNYALTNEIRHEVINSMSYL